jgi:hypothetical protein
VFQEAQRSNWHPLSDINERLSEKLQRTEIHPKDDLEEKWLMEAMEIKRKWGARKSMKDRLSLGRALG